MIDLAREKARLRRQLRRQRLALSPVERSQQEAALCRQLGGQLRRRRVQRIAAYLAAGSELDLQVLFNQASAQHLLFPRLRGAGLVFANAEQGLRRTRLGVDEPVSGKAWPAWSLSVMLLPLLACDRAGHRLGQGGGFYDRTLASCRGRRPLLIGVGFEQQLLDEIPHAPHDQAVDIFLSAGHALAFSPRGQRWLTGY